MEKTARRRGMATILAALMAVGMCACTTDASVAGQSSSAGISSSAPVETGTGYSSSAASIPPVSPSTLPPASPAEYDEETFREYFRWVGTCFRAPIESIDQIADDPHYPEFVLNQTRILMQNASEELPNESPKDYYDEYFISRENFTQASWELLGVAPPEKVFTDTYSYDADRGGWLLSPWAPPSFTVDIQDIQVNDDSSVVVDAVIDDHGTFVAHNIYTLHMKTSARWGTVYQLGSIASAEPTF